MAMCDQALWEAYQADHRFLRYLETCRIFDPEGFERAMKQDEERHSYDFRRVIVEAYREDSGPALAR